MKNATAAKVAQYGYDGMIKGKEVVIPGRTNQFITIGAALLPQSIKSFFVKRLQK
jgi:short-subunit dehydrogenase